MMAQKQLWKSPVTIDELERWNRGTIHDSLGIRFTEVGDDFLEATLPVDERTRQAAGLLHGGASVVLAESLGSIASALVVGPQDKRCVGVEINASHLGSMQTGLVTGRVTPIRLGKTLHVWKIEITSQSRPICHARLTVMIRD
jgi:1,4-dihydroxy-2-naphthoyl-CoA hydrolase